jgi:hypothetical protein
MRLRAELSPGEAKVEQFLSDLAVNGHVAAATQNQAFNALLFLYPEVLHEPFENVQAVRARRPIRVPTVLTPEEVFPARDLSTDPRSGVTRRHHVDEVTINKALGAKPPKPPQCDLKASLKRVDSHLIALPKPPASHLQATY